MEPTTKKKKKSLNKNLKIKKNEKKITFSWGAWLAQSEHETLDLRVMSSSPMLGIEIPLKIYIYIFFKVQVTESQMGHQYSKSPLIQTVFYNMLSCQKRIGNNSTRTSQKCLMK